MNYLFELFLRKEQNKILRKNKTKNNYQENKAVLLDRDISRSPKNIFR